MDPDDLDLYNLYSLDDMEWCSQYFEPPEQYQALDYQEVESSSPMDLGDLDLYNLYIPCEREDAEQWLLDDYFGNENNPPRYLERNFRRMYHMSSKLLKEIVNDITNYNVQPLPGYFLLLNNSSGSRSGCFVKLGFDRFLGVFCFLGSDNHLEADLGSIILLGVDFVD
ncbi:hypothetical protein Tco_1309887 [Tanacetum coccineum]